MLKRLILLLTFPAALVVSGCGSDTAASGEADPASVRAVMDAGDGYRVIFRGLVTDTLAGRAVFGHVREPATGQLNWILEFATADDFAGGMFIASPTAAQPEARRYSISDIALTDPTSDALGILYRHGLYRVFRGRAGSVTFTHVSDTLVAGTFDSVMVGEVADRGREAVRGEVEASGSFSARRGHPGYVIGL